MKTLLDDLHDLLALQELDTQIEKAKAELAGLDNGAKALAAYQAKKTEAEGLRTSANKALGEQRDAELKLASIETKASQVNKTLYGGTVGSAREMENLQKELEMLGRQKSATEETVLVAMDTATEAVAAAETAEKEQAVLAVRFKKTRAVFEARHKELTATLAGLQAPRAAAAEKLSRKDLLARYDTIRVKRAGMGAAALGAAGECGACHMQVSGQISIAVRAGDTVHVCESCGRILIAAP